MLQYPRLRSLDKAEAETEGNNGKVSRVPAGSGRSHELGVRGQLVSVSTRRRNYFIILLDIWKPNYLTKRAVHVSWGDKRGILGSNLD